MDRRVLAMGSLALAVAVAGATSVVAQGQGKAAAVPRTADGKPDLQGVWDFRTITPLQRPTELAGKEVLTDQEAAEFEKANQRNQDVREKTSRGVINGAPTNSDVERAYNDFWWDFGKKIVGTKRTSLIVDPPDGRIPELTEEGKKRQADRQERRERTAVGPEDRGVGERCVLGFNSGPPMLPSAYNNNVQIFQNKDTVVLLNEMVHNARVVPIDGRGHLAGGVRQWVGDSRGRWEGDTLVIETTNFLGETAFQGSSANLHLTEKFRRVDADTLLYEFTVKDPSTWTKPWTVQVPMVKSDDHLYEYACHEGNYGMTNLLSAARALDRNGPSAPKTRQ
ncbi:MAG: hypothetical protein AB7I13_08270 [Vicinamibacterales bacterium]